MSGVLNAIMDRLREKFPEPMPFSVKLSLDEEGSVMMDRMGIRVADEAAELTVRTTRTTLDSIRSGEVDPVTAYFCGDLEIDGDISRAIQFAKAFA